MLLDNGATIEENSAGEHPFDLALDMYKENPEMLNIFIQHDQNSKHPLEIALTRNNDEMTEYFLLQLLENNDAFLCALFIFN